MRILFLLNKNTYPQVVGGMELFNHHLIENLVDKHEIGIASRFYPDKIKGIERAKWFKIKKIWPSSITAPLQFFFILFFRIIKKFEIVILPFATCGGWYLWHYYMVILPLSFLLRKRLIIIIHSGAQIKCKPLWMFKLLFRNSTLIGVGNKISEFYRNSYNIDVQYIPSLIPFKTSKKSKAELREALNVSQHDLVMIHVGSFRKVKNVDTIIQAIKRLEIDYLNANSIKFFFLGEGETKEEMEQEIKESGLEKFVYFLGNKTKEEVADYYKLSDALVVASSYESLGQTLIEALYNELPIIASESVAGNAYLTAQNAFIFKAKDSVSLSHKMRDFIENKSSKQELIKKGKETYDTYFNYYSMIADYERLFNKLKSCN